MERKIVFIDDEEDLCEIYVDLFSSQQNIVKSFSNPHDALSYINENEVTLCFIDYRMPEMNGMEIRKQISQDLPCIILTGELEVETTEGFVEVLHKPINIDKIDEIINHYCDQTS